MKSVSNALKIENLSYKNILNNISFSLEEKTFNVLIGSNGSGKTTLVKCIAGLLEYEGIVSIFNEIVTKENYSELIKKMGVHIDSNYLIDGTSLYNITYPLSNLGYGEIEAKKAAYDISKKLDIEYLLTKQVSTLSLSEKKLVSFASAMVHKPKLIIVDDSFDELDSYYRKKVIYYMRDLKKSTVLFITNNEKYYLIADSLIFIKDGKIEKKGELNDFLEEEKIFVKNNSKQPFLVDLSNKLKVYELIDDVILDMDEMVKAIWK